MTLISVNPFGELRDQCTTLIQGVLREIFPEATAPPIKLDLPPNAQFGELTSSVCFEMTRHLGMSSLEIAMQIEKESEARKNSFPFIKSVKAEGQGYVNFYADLAEFYYLTLTSAKTLDVEYGYVKTNKPERIIVEHTSANPTSPLHVGQSRNSVLGDSLARILEGRGHRVFRHYYIDDVGRQSALIGYGYKLLGKPSPKEKPDHFIGDIYAVTSCLLEIRKLKEATNRVQTDPKRQEEFLKLTRDVDEWITAAAELQERVPSLFSSLLEKISKSENPEIEVNLLLREYEAGKVKTKRLIREISQLCVDGFKETFTRAGIPMDSWDWESTFVWNGDVTRYLEALKNTPYVFQEGEILEFDAEKVAHTYGLKAVFSLKNNYEIPSLTLGRSDGTTLYTTRDIPYSVWKFKRADKVINVIGMEQNLSQLQLKLALCALGYIEEAKRLVHFAYNLVRFPNHRISSRRGRYITFDEVMDESIARAYKEVSKRSPTLTQEKKSKISETVGVGAVKYALIETDPQKPVVFTWDRVLDFERNSGPYVQYSHARACSILRKASGITVKADYSFLKEPSEYNLVLMISRFPEIFVETADNLKPHVIADFANDLADKFNTFYAALPVIRAETPELSKARLILVDAVRITLRNALNLIGIEAPPQM